MRSKDEFVLLKIVGRILTGLGILVMLLPLVLIVIGIIGSGFPGLLGISQLVLFIPGAALIIAGQLCEMMIRWTNLSMERNRIFERIADNLVQVNSTARNVSKSED